MNDVAGGRRGIFSSRHLTVILFALMFPVATVSSLACVPGDDSSQAVVAQLSEADAAFQRVWERTDGPVANGSVDRTWIWGPLDRTVDVTEPYAEAPGGLRSVRYFDKSRMELTFPDGDPDDPWHVTNGLLVVELITGRRQIGDSSLEQRSPASIPVAGDPDNADVPTYATWGLLTDRAARTDGGTISERVSHDGATMEDLDLAVYGVSSAHRVTVPGIDHQIASVFWDFMNSSGPVTEGGEPTDDLLFLSPFYATGYPLTEAYWVSARIGGVEQDVLVQAFERRVLTYAPSNPDGWKVESGNVGLHYYEWLHGATGTPEPTATAPASPTAGPTTTPQPGPPTSTATSVDPGEVKLISIGPGAVDAWMRSVVRDESDRLWIVAMDNNAPRQGTGPGRLVIYRASEPGVPGAFELVDAGVVESESAAGEIVFADAAIDGQQRLHVIWVDRGQAGVPVLYGVFDLATAGWVVVGEEIDQSGLAGFGGNAGQGGVSIAIDNQDAVRVAYVVAGNQNQVRVRQRTDGGWGPPAEPLVVEGAFVWHPVLALGPGDEWHLAAYDATHRLILATHDTGQGWSDPAVVADDVLGPESIDQGPTMLVDSDDSPYILYVDAGSYLRLKTLSEGVWIDVQVSGDYFTHAPGLGMFADGTIVISGHDELHPPTAMNVLYGDESDWTSWEPLVQIMADGSAVFRWAGAHADLRNDYVDLVFFDEDLNEDGVFDDQLLYYVAVPPRSE